MYKSAPQTNVYVLIQKLQKANKIVFTSIILLSILSAFMASGILVLPEIIGDIRNILYILFMLSFSIITYTIDYNLLPEAQSLTRCDFFDHSFGTKFIHHNKSEEYYTNEDLDNGFYKMAVNMFESCFFSYSILIKMRFKKIVKCCLLLLVLIPLLFYGIKNTSLVTISLLQALLSVYFVNGLIKLFIYGNKNRELFNELKLLFSHDDLKTNTEKHTPHIAKLYTDYEAFKAWASLHLDSNVYNKLNEQLSKDWTDIKVTYNITQPLPDSAAG